MSGRKVTLCCPRNCGASGSGIRKTGYRVVLAAGWLADPTLGAPSCPRCGSVLERVPPPAPPTRTRRSVR